MVLEVADTGPGVAAQDAQVLFKAFHSTKATGMRMGLSISKSIVEAHGGGIAMETASGGGALFRVVLPAA